MDLINTYLMMNYLSGLSSTSSTSSLYSSRSSSTSLESTLSFLEILQNLQNSTDTDSVNSTQSSAGSSNSTYSAVSDETSGGFSSKLSAGSAMDAIFERAAEKYNVDADLLKAIGKTESNFDADAVSQAGAIGVMQLMPGTAASLGVSNPYDAEQNIMGGAKYISQMLSRYDGDVELALAAYNAGPGNVDKYDGIPPFAETQNYVNKVMNHLDEESSTINTAVSTEAATISESSSSSAATESKTDTLMTLYNLMRAQMELQLANTMFAWNTDDSSSSLLSL